MDHPSTPTHSLSPPRESVIFKQPTWAFFWNVTYLLTFLTAGSCCRKDCNVNPCTPGCVEYSKCTISQKGLFVEVRYFQFLDFDIHDDVKSRYLRQVTRREEEEQAKYELDEKVCKLIDRTWKQCKCTQRLFSVKHLFGIPCSLQIIGFSCDENQMLRFELLM